jgi:hypothetical protein
MLRSTTRRAVRQYGDRRLHAPHVLPLMQGRIVRMLDGVEHLMMSATSEQARSRRAVPENCPCQLTKWGPQSQRQPSRSIEEVIEARGFWEERRRWPKCRSAFSKSPPSACSPELATPLSPTLAITASLKGGPGGYPARRRAPVSRTAIYPARCLLATIRELGAGSISAQRGRSRRVAGSNSRACLPDEPLV